VTLAFTDLTRQHASALETALLGEVWSHQWSAELAHQIVEWRYWQRPAGHTHLALQDGRCVGILDAFERPYMVNNQVTLVRESCDWWSDPSLRASGVGLRLMRELMQEETPLISIGGSRINLELLPRLKWRCIGEVKNWLLPLRARDVAAVALRKQHREMLAQVVPGFVRLRRVPTTSPPAPSAGVREWLPGDGPLIPAPNTTGVAAILEEAQLEWLVAAPAALAEVRALEFSLEGQPAGFAIIQIEPTSLGAEGKIVHLQVREESSALLGWMVSDLVRRLTDARAGLVRARSGSPVLDAQLRRAGFVLVRQEPVYWWTRQGPLPQAPLHLSYLRADDGLPVASPRMGS
jgi:hypothetical protein